MSDRLYVCQKKFTLWLLVPSGTHFWAEPGKFFMFRKSVIKNNIMEILYFDADRIIPCHRYGTINAEITSKRIRKISFRKRKTHVT